MIVKQRGWNCQSGKVRKKLCLCSECVVTKNSNEGTQIRGIPMALAMSCWVGGREKGWGPLPLSLFFSLSLQLILLLMRCSHLKGFKFDPMPPTVTTVYLKNSCLEEAACGDLLTVFPHIILKLCDSSHANLIYITQPTKRWGDG